MNRKNLATLSSFFLAIILYSSCTRIDTTDIGNNLIPVVDNVNTFDTVFEVITDNFLFDDSSRIFDSEDHALGTIQNDPIFGKITAGIYFNVSPASFATYPFAIRDSIKQIDSVILSLAFDGVYGDSLSTQTFNIYELQNDGRFLDSINGYLIRDQGINLGPLLKSNHQVEFDRLSDRYVINIGKDTQVISNQMRIRLDNSLGQRFINYDTVVYRNDSTFRTAFPGFAILPQGGNQNALAYFNLANTDNTKLTVYYKASLNGITDSSLTTSFTFRNFRNLNKIERTIAGSEFGNALNPGTPADEKLYIATSPGSYATIKIPGLQELSNRVIHRAELVATPVTTPGSPYQAPYYLFLDAFDSTAMLPKTIQNDFTYNATSGQYNQALFGGFLNNGKYTFDISRYVQGIVTRKEKSYMLRLYAPYKTSTVYIPGGVASSYNVVTLDTTYKKTGVKLYLNPQIANGRTVLGGGNHPTSKMVLRIIYSKI